jgi:hypothetical protein
MHSESVIAEQIRPSRITHAPLKHREQQAPPACRDHRSDGGKYHRPRPFDDEPAAECRTDVVPECTCTLVGFDSASGVTSTNKSVAPRVGQGLQELGSGSSDFLWRLTLFDDVVRKKSWRRGSIGTIPRSDVGLSPVCVPCGTRRIARTMCGGLPPVVS